MSYVARNVKSIQYFTITITDPSTSGTATITSVNTARSIVVWLGHTANGSYRTRLTLTNATTVTATSDQGTGSSQTTTTSGCVVEYY